VKWRRVLEHTHRPADDQVFAIELKRGGRMIRLGHTHSLANGEAELFMIALLLTWKGGHP
jgi:hypothetical protein